MTDAEHDKENQKEGGGKSDGKRKANDSDKLRMLQEKQKEEFR